MNEPFIDTTGPSLGALSIYLRSIDNTGTVIMKPIWRLYNHQGPDWQYAQALIKDLNDAVCYFINVIFIYFFFDSSEM